MASLDLTVAVPALPGFRSTKKLPSRKMRGRIFASASLWIGRASSFSAIVTTDADEPSLVSIFVTLPTVTPATRTGEFAARLFAFENAALSSYGFDHGYLWMNAT